jgi:hypothetical protein
VLDKNLLFSSLVTFPLSLSPLLPAYAIGCVSFSFFFPPQSSRFASPKLPLGLACSHFYKEKEVLEKKKKKEGKKGPDKFFFLLLKSYCMCAAASQLPSREGARQSI